MKKIFIIAAVLGVTAVKAQQAVTNTGILRVHSGGSISFFGNFTNASTATFVNNGSTYAKATLSNEQASMSSGTGTLYLNGSNAQSVAGSQPVKAYNLTTDNANGITLNTNLHVANIHTFSNGRISTSATPNYLVYEAGSSYIGSSDARHVNGWVKKIGNTGFSFPVGNGTYLRPIAVSNLNATSEFNARHHQTTPNANNMDLPLQSINPGEYWTLNRVSGGTAQVTMNWDHNKIAFPNYIVSDIRTALYGTAWTNQGGTATGTTTTTGSITSNTMNTFGLMVLGSGSFVIPLDFLDVTAKRRNNVSVVEWRTANEVDVKAYEVQKGLTPTLFTTIGSINARNLQTEQTYFLNDPAHTNGIAYYRIKSIDNNGATKYSKIVSLNLNGKTTQPVLLTNPAKSKLVLSVPENYSSFQYQLTNAGGQVIMKAEAQRQGSLLTIALPAIPAGVYHLNLIYAGNLFNQKVVIQ